MNYDELLAPAAKSMRPSGIRKFFDLAAEMPHCISLGVGEPDFKTPWTIRDAGIRSLEQGRTRYTANAGIKELRAEICRYLARRMELNYQPSEVLVTVGGSEEKIHELFYQPEALELYRNGMKSVDEMKALIRYVTSSWTEHKSVDESKELLDKLKQYIDEHLESELRRDELAEYVHLNPDYLTRLMKKQTGYSLKEYVTRRKMETARTLLRTTTLPVGFIAAKLGYNNFSHFSYTYKKIMDVTPQEERHTEEK